MQAGSRLRRFVLPAVDLCVVFQHVMEFFGQAAFLDGLRVHVLGDEGREIGGRMAQTGGNDFRRQARFPDAYWRY